MANSFAVLGIHDEKVETIQGNVARVRMFIGDKQIDEDFDLPILPESIPPTEDVYKHFLTEKIEARMVELEGN